MSLKSALILTILQVIPLVVFEINLASAGFAVLLLLTNLLLFYFEKSGNLNFCRFISFLLLFILAGIFTSENLGLEFNDTVIEFLKSITTLAPPFFQSLNADFYKILTVTFGGMVLLNEINFLIRYFFEMLDLYPDQNKSVDEKEYNAGRVIGMLERILIYLFVIVNEITVIGFIIAAKGFTRFKELDKRGFAEYVLIGTLLSSLFALLVSFFIRKILFF